MSTLIYRMDDEMLVYMAADEIDLVDDGSLEFSTTVDAELHLTEWDGTRRAIGRFRLLIQGMFEVAREIARDHAQACLENSHRWMRAMALVSHAADGEISVGKCTVVAASPYEPYDYEWEGMTDAERLEHRAATNKQLLRLMEMEPDDLPDAENDAPNPPTMK